VLSCWARPSCWAGVGRASSAFLHWKPDELRSCALPLAGLAPCSGELQDGTPVPAAGLHWDQSLLEYLVLFRG
jgi:hypothetical protein